MDDPSPEPQTNGALPDASRARSPQLVAHFPDALVAAASGLGYILLQILIVRLHFTGRIALYASPFVSLAITLTYTVALAFSLRSRRSQAAALALTAAIMLPFVAMPYIRFSTEQQVAAARSVFQFYVHLFRVLPGLHGLLLISLAVAFGLVLSQLVREVKILLPVAVVLALVDLYVVFGGGLVTQANSGKSPAAQAAMQSLTVPLTPRPPAQANAPPPLAVGFADFLFISLFFGSFMRFHMPARRTFGLLCIILCLYMGVVLVTGFDLPALLPIAIVVIAGNLRAFRYERAEAFALLYAGLLVIAVLGALVFMSHGR